MNCFMDDDVYVRNVKMLLLETIYICLRIEAWFDSISVSNQVETLYAYLSKDRSLVQFNPNHRLNGNLISYLSKDRSLVQFNLGHRPSENLIFLFFQGQKLGSVRSRSSTKWKPYIPILTKNISLVWFDPSRRSSGNLTFLSKDKSFGTVRSCHRRHV